MAQSTRLRHPAAWNYLVCYGLWSTVLVVCYYSFWIWRGTAEVVAGYLLRRHPAFSSLYLLITLLAGVVIFAVLVASEGYLRNGIARGPGPLGILPGRFLRIALILALIAGSGIAIQTLIYQRFGL